jgi:hypothetical protein
MAEFLRGRVSDRRFWLFAAACCRRVWGLLRDDRSRHAVEAAERVADGLATEAERLAAVGEACLATHGGKEQAARQGQLEAWRSSSAYHAAHAAAYAADSSGPWDFAFLHSDKALRHRDGRIRSAAQALREGPNYVHHPDKGVRSALYAACAYGGAVGAPMGEELAAQCVLLRCIVGNPFRPSAIDPLWLAWNGGAVSKLARAAYEERRLPSGELDPARLAVLADALEDAGCADAELLGHLRGPGPHVRGCHALDAIMGKG